MHTALPLNVITVMTAPPVVSGLEWSWIAAAGYYSAVAGVLAGFTIAAIVLVLANPPEKQNQPLDGASTAHQGATAQQDGAAAARAEMLYHALQMAFFSLIISALLFAILSGDRSEPDATTTSVRAFFLGMLASSVLAFASVQLLLCMLWCARAYRPAMTLRGEQILFGALLLLVGLMILVVHGDVIWVIEQVDWKEHHLDLVVWAGTLLVLLPIGGGSLARVVATRKVSPLTVYPWTLGAAGVFVTLAALTYGWLADATPDEIRAFYQPGVSIVIMGFMGICLFLCVWSLPPGTGTANPARKPVDAAGEDQEAPVQLPMAATVHGKLPAEPER